MSSPWYFISFGFANPYFMRFDFHDVFFPVLLSEKKKMPFVFSEEIDQSLMNVCFALAQINEIVTGSHRRVRGPFCLPW